MPDTDNRPTPPDLEQCQTMRPSTWPHMPSLMTFGPVSYTRCTDVPTWIGTDGVGSMTLCDECKGVMAELMSGVILKRLGESDA